MAGILLADIGGTHARFALYHHTHMTPIQIYDNQDYTSFHDILTTYLKTLSQKPTVFILGGAGIIQKNTLHFSNLNWEINAKQLKKEFHFQNVLFVNDFTLQGLGVLKLKKKDILPLSDQKPISTQPSVLIGPGTGLGCCFIHQGIVLESEAGHSTLTPISPLQQKIATCLSKRFAPLSFERVLSGPGLINIYNALTQIKKINRPIQSTEALYHLALKQEPTALETYQLFFEFLGIFAGNLALSLKTGGGVYLSGNILQDKYVLELFQKSQFAFYFMEKGRLKNYLKTIPIYLVLKPHMAFDGLKYLAQRL